MNKSNYPILFLIVLYLNSFGQTIEPSVGIEKSKLQIELEILYSFEKDELNKNTTWNIPSVLVRYGLTENVELQLHSPFTKNICFENNKLISNVLEFNEIELGVSVNLWKQNKLLPEAALMARIVSSTNEFNLSNIGNLISLNLSNTISEKIGFNYNIGTFTDIDNSSFVFYIVNISYEPSSKMHFFIENSSDFTFKSVESNCLSTGFGLNLNDNLVLDFSVARNLRYHKFVTGALLSWTIATKRNRGIVHPQNQLY